MHVASRVPFARDATDSSLQGLYQIQKIIVAKILFI
jgi:hypothetical protein